MPDIRVYPRGSVVVLAVLTEVARKWMDANMATESRQWYGRIVGVESRLALRLLRDAHDDGLALEVG